jgi:hypothetical protein
VVEREDGMQFLTHARLALALALVLSLGASARGQDDLDAAPADPEATAEQGFPWLCFATALGTLGGLYVLVRRREREAEADPAKAVTWYCRACDEDVSGSACPHCRAPNPFESGPVEADLGIRPGRGRDV